MSMNDPIADMLTRIRNANNAALPTTSMPTSSKLEAIAKILLEQGYIADWRIEKAEPVNQLVITLKYGNKRERTITGIKRVSKPGLRQYVKAHDIPRVLGGLGIAIISTSRGIMSDHEARLAGVGGEVLAHVW